MWNTGPLEYRRIIPMPRDLIMELLKHAYLDFRPAMEQ